MKEYTYTKTTVIDKGIDDIDERLYNYKVTWISTQELNHLLDYGMLEVNCPYCEGCYEYAFSKGDIFDATCSGCEQICSYCNEHFYVAWEGDDIPDFKTPLF